jgi:DNA-binding MarR family transcriptional regulator
MTGYCYYDRMVSRTTQTSQAKASTRTARALLEPYRLLIADVYELAGTSRRTSDLLAAELGQTAARWHVMSVISVAACTVPEIAHRLGLARQSVQRVVDDLATTRMVELLPNPMHARSPRVALTKAGARTLEQLFAASDRDRAELLDRAGVSAKQLAAARSTLHSLLVAFAGEDAPA